MDHIPMLLLDTSTRKYYTVTSSPLGALAYVIAANKCLPWAAIQLYLRVDDPPVAHVEKPVLDSGDGPDGIEQHARN